MTLARTTIGARLTLVAALSLTALVGDLRGDVGRDGGASGPVQDVAESGVRHPRVLPVGSEEEGQLIPAVYAWDPAVRFVYYRHVSKWM